MDESKLLLVAVNARSTGTPYEDLIGNPTGDIWMSRVPQIDEYIEWMGHIWRVTSVFHRTWNKHNKGVVVQVPVATIEVRWVRPG